MISRWWNWITDRPIAIYILIFILSTGLVVLVSFPDYSQEFWYNVRVEAHGMLFDILVLGLLFSWLYSRGEKRRLIQRYLDEIDDFRGWEAEEAARRIRGNIFRLNREGINAINLRNCFLKGAKLHKVNLKGADLKRTNLEGAYLVRANLEGAFFGDANLEKAHFYEANFEKADLTKANLEEAQFGDANLAQTNLTEANLEKGFLWGANLTEADLTNANLKGASLYEANLKAHILSESTVTGKKLMNKPKTVTHRSKGNNKDISREPETKELKRMIRDGELDPERTVEHLKRKDKKA